MRGSISTGPSARIKGGRSRSCIRRAGVLGSGGAARTSPATFLDAGARDLRKRPYEITQVEESTDGSGFNIRDLTTNKPAVHFAYATPQDAREVARLAERLIANVVL
jgi:hypothetical protein